MHRKLDCKYFIYTCKYFFVIVSASVPRMQLILQRIFGIMDLACMHCAAFDGYMKLSVKRITLTYTFFHWIGRHHLMHYTLLMKNKSFHKNRCIVRMQANAWIFIHAYALQVFVEIGDWRPLFPTRVGEEIGDIGQARLNTVSRVYQKYLCVQVVMQFLLSKSCRVAFVTWTRTFVMLFTYTCTHAHTHTRTEEACI